MANNTVDIGLVHNVNGLDKLRVMSKSESLEAKKNALITAATQFESLLNQFWLKEMRSANESICPDSPLHSKDSSIFQSMLDEQMVTRVASQNIKNPSSLSFQIVRQFAASMGDEGKEILAMIQGKNNASDMESNIARTGLKSSISTEAQSAMQQLLAEADELGHKNSKEFNGDKLSGIEVANNKVTNTSQSLDARKNNKNLAKRYESVQESDEVNGKYTFRTPSEFVDKIMPLAQKVAAKFGLNPIVIVGQAALETGWGKHIGASNNMFGIKAGASWQGESEAKASDEYVNNVRVSEISNFRSYNSIMASMEDYAKFIMQNKRYSKAVEVNDDPNKYFEEIQKAGYATDPNYAKKLKSVISNEAFSSYL